MIKNIISAIALGVFIFIAFGSGEKEGGVRVNNNMEKYALEYIENNNILNEGEKIKAYYDYTISLSSKECAILTDERIIYHNTHTHTKFINLEDVKNTSYEQHPIDGDIIHIEGKEEFIIIKIAYLNDGKTFLKMLEMEIREIREIREKREKELYEKSMRPSAMINKAIDRNKKTKCNY